MNKVVCVMKLIIVNNGRLLLLKNGALTTLCPRLNIIKKPNPSIMGLAFWTSAYRTWTVAESTPAEGIWLLGIATSIW